MGLYSSFKTSPDLEKKGISLVFNNARITCARAGGANKAYTSRAGEWARTNAKRLELGAVSNDENIEANIALFADTIITDWETDLNDDPNNRDWHKGIESPDGGELLSVNRENVISTLIALPDLFIWLAEECRAARNFRQALIDARSGN